jgi:hypothetical protein
MSAPRGAAVLELPFRMKVHLRIMCALRIARCRDADAPKRVRVFFSFDARDRVTTRDCFGHLRRTIYQIGVGSFGAVDPPAMTVGPTHPEAVFGTGMIAYLLKFEHAVKFIVVGCETSRSVILPFLSSIRSDCSAMLCLGHDLDAPAWF